MFKFFRQIRYDLMGSGKTRKYLKYAIGEIILVVIGILIALQINDWNTHRINGIKETRILLEIKDNLNEDLLSIENVLNANTLKTKTVDTAFYYMSIMDGNPILGKEFSYLMPILTNYDLFNPTRVAFDTMVSSGNIDILESETLRKDISRYYSSDLLDGIQDQLKITTQEFLNEAAPKMINTVMMKSITNLDFEVQRLEDVVVYKDPYVISDLFVMKNKIKEHNKALNTVVAKINALIVSIDMYLNTK